MIYVYNELFCAFTVALLFVFSWIVIVIFNMWKNPVTEVSHMKVIGFSCVKISKTLFRLNAKTFAT
jgi:hypothetical protein